MCNSLNWLWAKSDDMKEDLAREIGMSLHRESHILTWLQLLSGYLLVEMSESRWAILVTVMTMWWESHSARANQGPGDNIQPIGRHLSTVSC